MTANVGDDPEAAPESGGLDDDGGDSHRRHCNARSRAPYSWRERGGRQMVPFRHESEAPVQVEEPPDPGGGDSLSATRSNDTRSHVKLPDMPHRMLGRMHKAADHG